MEIRIADKRQLNNAAKKLLEYSGDRKIFAFYGTMGAGKTTLIKAVCEVLGVTDIPSSPTFTLVNEYRTASGQPVYHIDFYRIKKQEEVFDFGIEEYLTGNDYCFMEWPELVEEILPKGIICVSISVGSDDQRTLNVS
jgi:tRNA threonylcarbamoyladenosine biosynthesis protein TsaE